MKYTFKLISPTFLLDDEIQCLATYEDSFRQVIKGFWNEIRDLFLIDEYDDIDSFPMIIYDVRNYSLYTVLVWQTKVHNRLILRYETLCQRSPNSFRRGYGKNDKETKSADRMEKEIKSLNVEKEIDLVFNAKVFDLKSVINKNKLICNMLIEKDLLNKINIPSFDVKKTIINFI